MEVRRCQSPFVFLVVCGVPKKITPATELHMVFLRVCVGTSSDVAASESKVRAYERVSELKRCSRLRLYPLDYQSTQAISDEHQWSAKYLSLL